MDSCRKAASETTVKSLVRFNMFVKEDDIHYCDSLEKIQMCLNCPLPSCRNCLGGPGHMRTGKKPKEPGAFYAEVKEEFRKCVEFGMTIQDLAAKFDIAHTTVSRWKKRLRAEGVLI